MIAPPTSAKAPAAAGDAAAHGGSFAFIPGQFMLVVIVYALLVTTCLSYERVFSGSFYPLPAVPTLRACVDLAAFLAIAALLLSVLPGERYSGPVTPRGAVPTYVNNALAHCLSANAIFILGAWLGAWPLTVLIDDFPAKVTLLNLFGVTLCIWLAVKPSDGPDHTRAGKGRIYDYFWGVELYPKVPPPRPSPPPSRLSAARATAVATLVVAIALPPTRRLRITIRCSGTM